ncbi:MAG: hypothetical protein EOO25_01550 [Comamonadaceae bacterium]|nr:MAG: hypothetical protein EOO25_01550 [Comamonadaceae bacterium]
MEFLFKLILRLVLLAAGLLFALVLLVGAGALLAVWGVRMGWARLTGRPVTAFVFRMDPRAGFGRVYRGAGGQAAPQEAASAHPVRRPIADITDVVPKEPQA